MPYRPPFFSSFRVPKISGYLPPPLHGCHCTVSRGPARAPCAIPSSFRCTNTPESDRVQILNKVRVLRASQDSASRRHDGPLRAAGQFARSRPPNLPTVNPGVMYAYVHCLCPRECHRDDAVPLNSDPVEAVLWRSSRARPAPHVADVGEMCVSHDWAFILMHSWVWIDARRAELDAWCVQCGGSLGHCRT